ncbi:MAG TPA: glycosyltransferase family 1 protein [Synergistaceae bacterium]|nr:glycosyltransferase family 1 protein [Synergistaceae bacterium]
MKVCIDIQPAVGQGAGVGRYTAKLAEYLARSCSPGDELDLFCFDFKRRAGTIESHGAAKKIIRWCPGRLAQFAWKKTGWPPFNAFAGKADLYHFTNFIMPPLGKGRAVVSIHDMSFMRLPLFTEDKNLEYLEGKIKDTVNRADAIITISRFSAREIQDLLDVPPEKIFVTYPGIDSNFKPADPDKISALCERLKIKRPYLLSVGTFEPRKNFSFLVDVLEKMKNFHGSLVIAGNLGWKYQSILARIKNSPMADRIYRLPDVNQEDLTVLYGGAEIFVFPSFYEGFGFPPLEAMACGTPVVSSSGGSLSEVLDNAAVIPDKFEADLWAERIEEIIGNADLRKKMISCGLKHARQYKWEDTAKKIWEVYRTVLGCKIGEEA